MRIVIDCRMYNESGIGRYIRNLISNIALLDNQNEYIILKLKSTQDTLVDYSNFEKISVDFKWYGVSEQIKLPQVLNHLKPDLVHFPHFNVPIFYKRKFIITIHDLIHQHFQMNRATTLNPLTYSLKQLGYRKVFKSAVLNSSKILVPSQYVKRILRSEWEVHEDKVIVTPEAVDKKILDLVKKIKQTQVDKTLKKFNIASRFIFYIGNAHPHKNVEGLIKAYLTLKEKDKDLLLVLSGYDHYFWKKIRSENHSEGIIYTGSVTDEELVTLYNSAMAFIMPSYEEGFGIPLLEAMACSCAVVSSNAGSLSEVGKDAAIYFDPSNIEDMVSKISEVLNNEDLRKTLISKGLKRVKLFSWEKLAKQTLEVYRECA